MFLGRCRSSRGGVVGDDDGDELTYTAIQAAIYGLAATTLQGVITHYGGPDIPWWAPAAPLVVIVDFLGYHSIDVQKDCSWTRRSTASVPNSSRAFGFST